MKHTINGLTKAIQSKPLPISRGVPQGSVLGPVLFVLFINDFPQHLEEYSKLVMYADDTVLLTANKDIERLEIDSYIALNLAQDYCIKNDLVLNEKKTKQITIGKKKTSVSDMPNLTAAVKIKHLGVLIDENMSWNSHVDDLCLKLSSSLYALRRTKTISTPEATRAAYHALFESHLRYGIIVWGGSSEGNLHRVLVMQKKAIRIITGLKPRESCRNAFRKENILTATSIFILESVLHIMNNNLPKQANIHNYNTRHAGNYTLPIHRTVMFEKKPSYVGLKMYNTLPEDLKMNNPAKMKTSLRRWLQQQAFYSLKEFFDWRDQD